MLPRAFHNYMDQDHDFWSVGGLFRWIINGGLLDPATKRPFGGFSGVLHVYLTIVKTLLSVEALIKTWPQRCQKPYEVQFTESHYQPLRDSLSWLRSTIQKDLDVQTGKFKIELSAANRSAPWAPKRIHYTNSNDEDTIETWMPQPTNPATKPPSTQLRPATEPQHTMSVLSGNKSAATDPLIQSRGAPPVAAKANPVRSRPRPVPVPPLQPASEDEVNHIAVSSGKAALESPLILPSGTPHRFMFELGVE